MRTYKVLPDTSAFSACVRVQLSEKMGNISYSLWRDLGRLCAFEEDRAEGLCYKIPQENLKKFESILRGAMFERESVIHSHTQEPTK